MAEEPVGAGSAPCLFVDRIVWIGAKAGRAHLKTPLPLSLLTATCAFHDDLLQALRGADVARRSSYESGSYEATLASLRADLAINAFLARADLAVLPSGDGLPQLPHFATRLYTAPGTLPPVAAALASCIGES